jgi:DNA polymerase III subunit epsilon
MGRDLAFIDFETTGLSPGRGHRIIEVGIAVLTGGRITDRYQSLVNPGRHIPWVVEDLTGINDEMVEAAPPARVVMREVLDFVGDRPLVAHNAGFDRRFYDMELDRIRRKRKQDFICSLRVARRLFPRAKNHRLETLIRLTGLRPTRLHRALADSVLTARLWHHMIKQVRRRYRVRNVPIELMEALQYVRVKDGSREITKWFDSHK